MTKLFYRFDSADLDAQAIELGFQRMWEIPPRDFLDKDTVPVTPNTNAVCFIQSALSRGLGQYIQLDYEYFKEMIDDNTADISFEYRRGGNRQIKYNNPFASIGGYGLPRLIQGEINPYVERLAKELDHFNVICFRKGDEASINEKGLTLLQDNLHYCHKLDPTKPTIITISPLYKDTKADLFYRMSHEEWTETLQTALDSVHSLYGVYCWSNLVRHIDKGGNMLAESWSVNDAEEYITDFMQQTKDVVESQ